MGTVLRRRRQLVSLLQELLLVNMGSAASYRVSSGGRQRVGG